MMKHSYFKMTKRFELPNILKQNLRFKKWQGPAIKDNYNGKAVIDFQGEPVFAELAVLRSYQRKGWNGVWVDCYRKKFRINLPERSDSIVSLPPRIERIINSIKKYNTGLSGCWDILLWKGKIIRFIELKRFKKDKVRLSQIRFFNAALKSGISKNAFTLVEWDLVS